ncbi:unnamed protein product [Pseudo-nitzschia multistriata]|uniref:Uncharacterized protein n=1 Tax=Pseudo-nitzschia multistriata TaxID=183589 RepID=A0A448ZFI7_9STRA|nr:unnamed protein product [Pseudo-nitzschia multistriata]
MVFGWFGGGQNKNDNNNDDENGNNDDENDNTVKPNDDKESSHEKPLILTTKPEIKTNTEDASPSQLDKSLLPTNSSAASWCSSSPSEPTTPTKKALHPPSPKSLSLKNASSTGSSRRGGEKKFHQDQQPRIGHNDFAMDNKEQDGGGNSLPDELLRQKRREEILQKTAWYEEHIRNCLEMEDGDLSALNKDDAVALGLFDSSKKQRNGFWSKGHPEDKYESQLTDDELEQLLVLAAQCRRAQKDEAEMEMLLERKENNDGDVDMDRLYHLELLFRQRKGEILDEEEIEELEIFEQEQKDKDDVSELFLESEPGLANETDEGRQTQTQNSTTLISDREAQEAEISLLRNDDAQLNDREDSGSLELNGSRAAVEESSMVGEVNSMTESEAELLKADFALPNEDDLDNDESKKILDKLDSDEKKIPEGLIIYGEGNDGGNLDSMTKSEAELLKEDFALGSEEDLDDDKSMAEFDKREEGHDIGADEEEIYSMTESEAELLKADFPSHKGEHEDNNKSTNLIDKMKAGTNDGADGEQILGLLDEGLNDTDHAVGKTTVTMDPGTHKEEEKKEITSVYSFDEEEFDDLLSRKERGETIDNNRLYELQLLFQQKSGEILTEKESMDLEKFRMQRANKTKDTSGLHTKEDGKQKETTDKNRIQSDSVLSFPEDTSLEVFQTQLKKIGLPLEISFSLFRDENDSASFCDNEKSSSMSTISGGDESYIMDLVNQKDRRDDERKEECLEDAYSRYQRAIREDNAQENEELLQTIFSEVLKEKEEEMRLVDKEFDELVEHEVAKHKEKIKGTQSRPFVGTEGKAQPQANIDGAKSKTDTEAKNNETEAITVEETQLKKPDVQESVQNEAKKNNNESKRKPKQQKKRGWGFGLFNFGGDSEEDGSSHDEVKDTKTNEIDSAKFDEAHYNELMDRIKMGDLQENDFFELALLERQKQGEILDEKEIEELKTFRQAREQNERNEQSEQLSLQNSKGAPDVDDTQILEDLDGQHDLESSSNENIREAEPKVAVSSRDENEKESKDEEQPAESEAKTTNLIPNKQDLEPEKEIQTKETSNDDDDDKDIEKLLSGDEIRTMDTLDENGRDVDEHDNSVGVQKPKSGSDKYRQKVNEKSSCQDVPDKDDFSESKVTDNVMGSDDRSTKQMEEFGSSLEDKEWLDKDDFSESKIPDEVMGDDARSSKQMEEFGSSQESTEWTIKEKQKSTCIDEKLEGSITLEESIDADIICELESVTQLRCGLHLTDQQEYELELLMLLRRGETLSEKQKEDFEELKEKRNQINSNDDYMYDLLNRSSSIELVNEDLRHTIELSHRDLNGEALSEDEQIELELFDRRRDGHPLTEDDLEELDLMRSKRKQQNPCFEQPDDLEESKKEDDDSLYRRELLSKQRGGQRLDKKEFQWLQILMKKSRHEELNEKDIEELEIMRNQRNEIEIDIVNTKQLLEEEMKKQERRKIKEQRRKEKEERREQRRLEKEQRQKAKKMRRKKKRDDSETGTSGNIPTVQAKHDESNKGGYAGKTEDTIVSPQIQSPVPMKEKKEEPKRGWGWGGGNNKKKKQQEQLEEAKRIQEELIREQMKALALEAEMEELEREKAMQEQLVQETIEKQKADASEDGSSSWETDSEEDFDDFESDSSSWSSSLDSSVVSKNMSEEPKDDTQNKNQIDESVSKKATQVSKASRKDVAKATSGGDHENAGEEKGSTKKSSLDFHFKKTKKRGSKKTKYGDEVSLGSLQLAKSQEALARASRNAKLTEAEGTKTYDRPWILDDPEHRRIANGYSSNAKDILLSPKKKKVTSVESNATLQFNQSFVRKISVIDSEDEADSAGLALSDVEEGDEDESDDDLDYTKDSFLDSLAQSFRASNNDIEPQDDDNGNDDDVDDDENTETRVAETIEDKEAEFDTTWETVVADENVIAQINQRLRERKRVKETSKDKKKVTEETEESRSLQDVPRLFLFEGEKAQVDTKKKRKQKKKNRSQKKKDRTLTKEFRKAMQDVFDANLEDEYGKGKEAEDDRDDDSAIGPNFAQKPSENFSVYGDDNDDDSDAVSYSESNGAHGDPVDSDEDSDTFDGGYLKRLQTRSMQHDLKKMMSGRVIMPMKDQLSDAVSSASGYDSLEVGRRGPKRKKDGEIASDEIDPADIYTQELEKQQIGKKAFTVASLRKEMEDMKKNNSFNVEGRENFGSFDNFSDFDDINTNQTSKRTTKKKSGTNTSVDNKTLGKGVESFEHHNVGFKQSTLSQLPKNRVSLGGLHGMPATIEEEDDEDDEEAEAILTAGLTSEDFGRGKSENSSMLSLRRLGSVNIKSLKKNSGKKLKSIRSSFQLRKSTQLGSDGLLGGDMNDPFGNGRGPALGEGFQNETRMPVLGTEPLPVPEEQHDDDVRDRRNILTKMNNTLSSSKAMLSKMKKSTSTFGSSYGKRFMLNDDE